MFLRTLFCCLLACLIASPLHAAPPTSFEHFTLDAPFPASFQTNTLYKLSGVAGATTSSVQFSWSVPGRASTWGAVTAIRGASEERSFTSWLMFKEVGEYVVVVKTQASGGTLVSQEFTITVTQSAGAPPALTEEFLNSYFGRLKYAQPVVQFTTTSFQPPLLTLNLQGKRSKPKSITLGILALQGTSTPEFHDDGKNGDVLAGDDIYSVQLPACIIASGLCIYPSFNPLVDQAGIAEYMSYADIEYEDGTTEFISTRLGLLSADIPLLSLQQLSSSVFRTERLLNIVDTNGALMAGRLGFEDWEAAGKRFYQYFPDRFDFLFFRFSAFRNDGLNGYYLPVKVDFTGTGRTSEDAAASYGSKGRLEALQYINFLAGGPQIHETMHHWANQTPFLLAGNGSHWGVSNTNGVLGGRVDFSKVTSLGNNEYLVPGFEGGTSYYSGKYSKLELYMAGLVPASEVPPVTILKNAEFVRYQVDGNGTIVGQVYRSTEGIKTYTIDDIIREVGPRTPAFGSAQTQYTAGTVVISPTPLDQLSATWLDQQMKLFASSADSDYTFAGATGFRATMDTRLGVALSTTATSLSSSQNPSTTTQGVTFNATVTGGAAGVDVVFSSSGTEVCRKALTANGQVQCTPTALAGGLHSITATYVGDETRGASTSAAIAQTVIAQAQSISLSIEGGTTLARGRSASISASATSGLTVNVVSSTPLVCYVLAGTVTGYATGTCTLTATQTGNHLYAAAPSVSVSVEVVVVPTTTSLSSSQTVATTPQDLVLTATVGGGTPSGSVKFSLAGTDICWELLATNGQAQCTVSTLRLGVGVHSITARYLGDFGHEESSSSPFTQTVVGQAQSISLSLPASTALAYGTVATMSASASSGLTVALSSSTPTVCQVVTGGVYGIKGGTCTIVASQAGNSEYAAAPSISTNFKVLNVTGLGNVRTTGAGMVNGVFFIGGAYAANSVDPASSFTATQPIDVFASIAIDQAHVGKLGRLYVLAVLPDGRQFMQNEAARFVPFTSLATIAARSVQTLQPYAPIAVASGLRGDTSGLAGKAIAVYVGYALDSAPQEIWYGGNPIRFTIDPP